MSRTGDLPTMSAMNYQNSSYAGGQMLGGAHAGVLSNQLAHQGLHKLAENEEDVKRLEELLAMTETREQTSLRRAINKPATTKKEPAMPARRIVQVYIADPSEDVPLANAVLYTGKQQMTDLTDQELFFEIDIRDLLAEHNEKRAKIINKKVKDRTEYLEPVKVRDLKMVVVTVASF